MSKAEQTPEERFGKWRGIYVQSTSGDVVYDLYTVMQMTQALNDRIDSLDAEVGRLTEEVRVLQGANR